MAVPLQEVGEDYLQEAVAVGSLQVVEEEDYPLEVVGVDYLQEVGE
jgi:hypothetical protein